MNKLLDDKREMGGDPSAIRTRDPRFGDLRARSLDFEPLRFRVRVQFPLGYLPSYPLCNRATVQLWSPTEGARNLEPDRAGSRHRCSLLQPIAVACKAGAVSTRYFLVPLRFPKLRVAGSRPSPAWLRKPAKLAREPGLALHHSRALSWSCEHGLFRSDSLFLFGAPHQILPSPRGMKYRP